MVILVTGAAGFIANHLIKELLEEGFFVIGLDCLDDFYSIEIKRKNISDLLRNKNFKFYELDLKEPNLADEFEENFDIVVHLAARAGVLPSVKNPDIYISNNINATYNVLELMKRKNCKKMVFASSSSIYGNNKKIPFREDDIVDFPISPYAFTKKSCELINHTYHYLYNFDIINLRLFTVYGPRQRPDLAIHKFVHLINQNKPIEMYGDGATARDYTFVSDTVEGFKKAIQHLLVDLIYNTMKKKPNIIYKSYQPGDVEITYADISKAKTILGYNPSITIEDGLEKFITWFFSNQK